MEIKKIAYITEQSKWEVSFVEQTAPLLLSEDTMVHFELIQGKRLTESLKDEIVTFDLVQIFYQFAIKYLHRRRTSQEVSDFLKQKHQLSDDVITQIIDMLQSQNYIDDIAYGKAYIHDQIAFQKKSFLAVVQKLKEKGLRNEHIGYLKEWFYQKDALIDEEEMSLKNNINQLINKLKIYNQYERNQRIIAKMIQKGYNRDTVKKMLEAYTETIVLDEYDKQQLFQKTAAKRQKMKSAAQYIHYMQQYNLTSEEVREFFNNERMNSYGE